MKKITKSELNKIIENHNHWLRKDCDGWEYMQADLSWTDLSWASLQRVNLSCADLYRADLTHANLSGANLSGANLEFARLAWTHLFNANLSGANLSRTNMLGTNLSGATLSGANLSKAENVPYIPITCPDTGAFIAWKKVNDYIIKLQIPEDAKRYSASTSKCRCDKALVLAIENQDGTDSGETTLINKAYAPCVYTVGEMVYPDSWDSDRWNECSHGIHFFINRQEAVNW